MSTYSKFLTTFAALSFSSGAMAKDTFLDVVAVGDRQRARMEVGVEAIDSALEHSSVRIVESEEKTGKRGRFSIAAFNASGSPVNFGPENVTITLADGSPLTVVPYERLVKEQKNRMLWASVLGGVAAVSNNMAASDAGYQSGTVAYSGTTFSRYGTFNSRGTGTYSGYNAAAANVAQASADAQNEAMFDRLAASNAASLQALKANLRTSTIDAGASFGGLITFDIPSNARKPKQPLSLQIVVEIAGDKHVFSGTLVQK